MACATAHRWLPQATATSISERALILLPCSSVAPGHPRLDLGCPVVCAPGCRSPILALRLSVVVVFCSSPTQAHPCKTHRVPNWNLLLPGSTVTGNTTEQCGPSLTFFAFVTAHSFSFLCTLPYVMVLRCCFHVTASKLGTMIMVRHSFL